MNTVKTKITQWKYCPLCSSLLTVEEEYNINYVARCNTCNFVYEDNPVCYIVALVENNLGEVLVQQTLNNKTFLPVFKVEKGNNIENTIFKEVLLETGLMIDQVNYQSNHYTTKDNESRIYLAYRCRVVSDSYDEANSLNSDSDKKWISRAYSATTFEEIDKEVFEVWRSYEDVSNIVSDVHTEVKNG